MNPRTIHTVATLAIAVAAATLPTRAHAGRLMVGPTSVNGLSYTTPTLSNTPGLTVNNAGVAIGWTTPLPADPDAGYQGPVGIRWSEGGNGTLVAPGTPSGPNSAESVYPKAINGNGVVVGFATMRDDTGFYTYNRAVRWNSPTGTPQFLDSLGVSNWGEHTAAATAVNSAGLVVGSAHAYTPEGNDKGQRAVRWAPGSSTPTELGHLGLDKNGETQAAAYAVNDAGTIVGYVDRYGSDGRSLGYRAVRWNAGGTTATMLDTIATAAGYGNSVARAVNASGTAVGWADKYDGYRSEPLGTRAVRWDAGGVKATELDALSNTSDGYNYSQAVAVNDAGTAVGFSELYNDVGQMLGTRAVRWAAGGSAATELGHLGTDFYGTTSTSAVDINERGTAAGYADIHDDQGEWVGTRAVVWYAHSTEAINLNLLAGGDYPDWQFIESSGISDTGFVTGIGLFDVDGAGSAAPYERPFTLLVPRAGTYGQGDATFDTKVNFDDLLLLAQHYGQQNPTKDIHVGDFDLSGSVDFDDLLALAQHYGSGTTPAGLLSERFAADWALAQSLVPEPTVLAALLPLTLIRRKRM